MAGIHRWGLVALLARLTLAPVARADEVVAPEWITKPPAATERFRYYIGHSEDSLRPADGVFAASLEALGHLVGDCFPGLQAPAGAAPAPLPLAARFDGVEEYQYYQTRSADTGRYETFVLYRYTEEARQAELARQKRSEPEPPSATGFRSLLRLRIDRPNALVLVDGHPVGASVGRGWPLEIPVVGRPEIDVEVSHPDTVRAIRRYTLQAGVTETRDLKLTDRPGYLTLSTEPPGANAEIEETASTGFQTPVDRLKVSPGRHKITFRLAGYETQSITVTILRDRLVKVPTVTLFSAAEKLKRLSDPPWLFSVSAVGNQAGTLDSPTVGAYTYGASVEHRFGSFLRLRLEYLHGSGTNSITVGQDLNAQSEVTDSISSGFLRVGFPFEVVSFTPLQRLYFEPAWVHASHTVGGIHLQGSATQEGVGATLEFRQFLEPGEDSLFVGGFGARVGLTDYLQTSGGLGGRLASSWTLIEVLIGF